MLATGGRSSPSPTLNMLGQLVRSSLLLYNLYKDVQLE